jgi:hypothetical protein
VQAELNACLFDSFRWLRVLGLFFDLETGFTMHLAVSRLLCVYPGSLPDSYPLHSIPSLFLWRNFASKELERDER